MSSRKVVFLIVSPGLVLAEPVMAAERGPASDAPPAAGTSVDMQPDQTRPPALDAAYGVPPADAQFDPSTTADPGFTEREDTRAADQTYGPTGQTIGPDGQVQDGLTLYGEDLSPNQDGYVDEVPEYHVVQPGDTLWDISGYYLADPYGWPKLWSWNEHITNAHWIFPGDRIVLHDPHDKRRRGDDDGPGLEHRKTKLPDKASKDSYMLSQIAFVDAEEYESSMKVIGGGNAQVMMATLDTAYMSYDKGNPPIPGERLIVYAPQEKVRDAEGKETIGYVVQIMGEVEIESVAREAAEGTIMNALNPVERGYRVGPLRRVFRRVETVEPDENQPSSTGVIVATLSSTGPIPIKSRRPRRSRDPELLAGEDQFVVVDVGTAAGVRAGNVLEVVRKGDAYTKKRVFKIPYEDGWPRRVIGALLIVETNENTSLAAVIYSRQELERGDHVELHGRGFGDEEDDAQGRDPNVEAEAEGSVQTGDGEAEAKGGFKLGGQ